MRGWLKTVSTYVFLLIVIVAALYWVHKSDPQKVVAASAAVNVLVVAFIFVADRVYQHRRHIGEIKLHWFRKLVSEGIRETVGNFFDGCLEIVEACKTLKQAGSLTVGEYSKEAHDLFARYSKLKMNLFNKFEEFSTIVDPDFGEVIREINLQFQDDFTTCLEQELNLTSQESDASTMIDLIERQRRETVRLVYEYERNGCELQTPRRGSRRWNRVLVLFRRDTQLPS